MSASVRRRVRAATISPMMPDPQHFSPRSFEHAPTNEVSKLHQPCISRHTILVLIRQRFFWVLTFCIIVGKIVTLELTDGRSDDEIHAMAKPKTVLYDGSFPLKAKTQSHFVRDPILNVNPGEECVSEPLDTLDGLKRDPNCVPMHPWQTMIYPTCNSIHEFDIGRSIIRRVTDSMSNEISGDRSETRNETYLGDILQLLGKGWYRQTWLLKTSLSESVVLKSLR